jgi:polygalacturonase
MFHLVPQDCTDVTIRHVTIRAPANSPNTDGIDPSGWNYFITGCFIDTGDDNIAIKPGKNRSPGDKNYLVTDCTFLHGHGMSVGGGTTGGLYGLTVSNCTFDATDSGIRIKTHRGAGGLLENAVYENLTMNAVKNPIYIIDWYPERTAPENPATEAALPVNSLTPLNRHIVIKNLTAGNCSTAGTIRGLPEAPISDVLLSNVNLSATFGLKIYHATNIQFVDSSVTSVVGKNIDAVDAHITGLAVPK